MNVFTYMYVCMDKPICVFDTYFEDEYSGLPERLQQNQEVQEDRAFGCLMTQIRLFFF